MSKVLICGDDAAVARVIQRLLESAGYSATVTRNGSTALEVLYRPGRVDLLITDLALPLPMSGRQLAVRAKALNADFPVIFIAEDPSEAASRSTIFRDCPCLMKPVSRARLLRAVNLMIGRPLVRPDRQTG